jgi:hypothetical protein
VAFGPHGPRTPTSLPGDGLKILLAVVGLLGASAVLHQVIRSFGTPFFLFVYCAADVAVWLNLHSSGQPLPKSMSKEWQEATNERAIEQKLNPITGGFFGTLILWIIFVLPRWLQNDSNQPLVLSARYHLGRLLRKRFRPIEIEGQYPRKASYIKSEGTDRRGKFVIKNFILISLPLPRLFCYVCLPCFSNTDFLSTPFTIWTI